MNAANWIRTFSLMVVKRIKKFFLCLKHSLTDGRSHKIAHALDKRKKTLIIVGIIIVIVISVLSLHCASQSQELASSYVNTVQTVEVERRNLLNSINASGRISGKDIVNITSTLNARVEVLNVNLGDRVNEGDILCVFDSSDYKREYDLLVENQKLLKEQAKHTHEVNLRALETAKEDKKIALEQAQRAIDQAKADRDNAYSRYNSLKTQYDECISSRDAAYQAMKNATNDDEYDLQSQKYEEYSQKAESLKSELDALYEQLPTYDNAVQTAKDAYTNTERTANNAIQAAQDALDAEKFNDTTSSQLEIDKLQAQIDSCTVVAPKAGIITSLNITEGSIPSTESIITIEDDSTYIINVIIKESDILSLKEGMECIVTTPATGTKEYHGCVTRVEKIMSSGENASEEGYKAEIEILDRDSNLFLGMNAKVQIILEKKDNVIAVPYDSIQKDETNNYYIYIVTTEDGITYVVKKCVIDIGLESDYYVEVISSEISESTIIITTPSLVNDGDHVLIVDVNERAYE